MRKLPLKLNQYDIRFLRYLDGANRRLHLILFPTETCNFNCVYCYERHYNAHMKSEVIEGIKNLISNRVRRGLERLTLVFFGGEPLLKMDVLLQLAEHAKRLSEASSLDFRGSVVTNGYLLARGVARKLIEYNIRSFQVTLDGPPHVHDSRRMLIGGRGTFEVIWANLNSLKEIEEDFRVLMRFNVDDSNYEDVKSFLSEVLRHFGDDARFELTFYPLRDWRDFKKEPDPSLRRRVYQLSLHAKSLGIKLNPGYKLVPMGMVCYAGLPNSFVIRADGTIQKCTVALYDELNNVGKLEPDGKLQLYEERLSQWLNLNALNFIKCRACEPRLREACQGLACPYASIIRGEPLCIPKWEVELLEEL